MMVRSFMELARSVDLIDDVRKSLNAMHTIAIGPPTKRVLEGYGVRAVMPSEYTFDGVLRLLVDLRGY
jgi:uroporphyrinogen-III synthase